MATDMQPPSQKKMPMPGAGEAPQASPQAMAGKAQADRKATRQVPREQLQAALSKGAEGVAAALYKNEKIRDSVVGMISAEDKVGSTAKATTMMLSNLNKKLQLPERIMPALTTLAADEVMQLAEATGVEYSEQEAKQVLMTATEIVLNSYGVDPERAKQLASSADKSTLQKAESTYKEALNG